MSRGALAVVDGRAVDSAALEPWFASAWADMWGPEPPAERPDASGWLVGDDGFEHAVALLENVPVGIVAYRATPEALELSTLAVARGQRNVGVGAEIVAQLEVSSGARHASATFPLANGYAFYFWLRSGYRPAFPATRNDGLNRVWRTLV